MITTRQPAPHSRDHAADSGDTETVPVGESMADAIERLMHVFGQRLELSMIVAVVRQCWHEMHIVAGPPHPDTPARLAYQRLTRLAERRELAADH